VPLGPIGIERVAAVLGQAPPPPLGWLLAISGIPVMLGIDGLHKRVRRQRARSAKPQDVPRGFTVLPVTRTNLAEDGGVVPQLPRGIPEGEAISRSDDLEGRA
jgi:hypothetical protein